MDPKKARPLPVDQVRRQTVQDNIRTHFQAFFLTEKKRFSDYVIFNLDSDHLQKNDGDLSDEINTLLSGYDWAAWGITIEVATQYIKEGFLCGADDAANALLIEQFRSTDPYAIDYAMKRIGELIGTSENPAFALSETTRSMIHDTLVSALEEGAQSIPDLADLIQSNYSFSDWRCENIARTETGTAYNMGTLSRYGDAGISMVEVFDGDEDSECADADGSEWDIEYAAEHPLQHPSCVRAFAAIVDDEEVDTS